MNNIGKKGSGVVFGTISATLTSILAKMGALLARTVGYENPAITDDAQVVYDVSLNPPLAQYTSPKFFTATFTDSTSLTLASVPFTITDASQIKYIKQINASNNVFTLVNGKNGTTFTHSANVVTIAGAGTPLTAADVYEVGIDDIVHGYDATNKVIKVIEQSPLSATTSPESVATNYELTASFADVGGEIDVSNYAYLTLWFTFDRGDSTNFQFRILGKHTSGGAEEYREIYLGVSDSNKTGINLNDYEVESDTDQLFWRTIPVTGVLFVQVQAKDDADGTGQIDALYATKSIY